MPTLRKELATMPHGDESQRNFNQSRSGFGERNHNYSPSVSYNYNPGGTQTSQQNPRRRTDRSKREMHNSTDKLIKQNNTIIKLLKEISDKLSAGQSSGGGSQPGGRSRGRRNDRRQKQSQQQNDQENREQNRSKEQDQATAGQSPNQEYAKSDSSMMGDSTMEEPYDPAG